MVELTLMMFKEDYLVLLVNIIRLDNIHFQGYWSLEDSKNYHLLQKLI